jgi:hypothetical protein
MVMKTGKPGNRKADTGGGRQETGDGRQETGDWRLENSENSRKPVAGKRIPELQEQQAISTGWRAAWNAFPVFPLFWLRLPGLPPPVSGIPYPVSALRYG